MNTIKAKSMLKYYEAKFCNFFSSGHVHFENYSNQTLLLFLSIVDYKSFSVHHPVFQN